MTTDTMVALLHGSPGTPRSWSAVERELERLAPDHQVVALAIPGWDRAQLPDVAPLTGDEIVDAVADQLHPDGRRVLLAGFSAGGAFALLLASRHVWDLAGLILFEPMMISALALTGRTEEHGATTGCLERTFRAIAAGATDPFREGVDMWYQPGAYDAFPDGVKAWLAAWAPLNVRDARALLDHAWDRATFARVDVPTVVTYGLAAPRVWQDFSESTCELLPNGRTRPIPGGTHALLDTHPTEVASIIVEQLSIAAR